MAREGALRLFDLGPRSMVETLSCWVEVPADGFKHRSLRWYEDWVPGSVRMVGFPGSELRTGPEGRSDIRGDCSAGPEPARIVRSSQESLEFSTANIGVPHLVRTSFFPTWDVSGAQGPFLASPWFMVVIPEQEVVTLTYDPGWAHRLGGYVSLAASIALLGAALLRLRRPPRARG